MTCLFYTAHNGVGLCAGAILVCVGISPYFHLSLWHTYILYVYAFLSISSFTFVLLTVQRVQYWMEFLFDYEPLYQNPIVFVCRTHLTIIRCPTLKSVYGRVLECFHTSWCVFSAWPSSHSVYSLVWRDISQTGFLLGNWSPRVGRLKRIQIYRL